MLRRAEVLFTCAFTPTAARARAARRSFIVLMDVLKGGCLSGSGGRKSVGLTETMKDWLGVIQDSVEEEE